MFSCKLFVTINAASGDMKCWHVWHILYLETMFLLNSHISVGIQDQDRGGGLETFVFNR